MLRRAWRRYNLWLDKRRLRRNIGTVREVMGLFGYSVALLTDADIIAGCDRLAEAGAVSGGRGITMAEAVLVLAMKANKPEVGGI